MSLNSVHVGYTKSKNGNDKGIRLGYVGDIASGNVSTTVA